MADTVRGMGVQDLKIIMRALLAILMGSRYPSPGANDDMADSIKEIEERLKKYV